MIDFLFKLLENQFKNILKRKRLNNIKKINLIRIKKLK